MTNAQRVKELCKTIEWVAMSYPAGLAEIRKQLDASQGVLTVTAEIDPPIVVRHPVALPDPWANDTRVVAEAADKIHAISPPTEPPAKKRGRPTNAELAARKARGE